MLVFHMKEIYLKEIDSTNKYLKEHHQELDDMTFVYTFNQTDGRGRLNRKWNNTGNDNIYASIILKPSEKMEEVYSNLTQYLCVVLAEIMEEYGVEPKIKWPNDIKVNNKKISGILAETVMSSGILDGIVLGFGVNLNTSRETLDNIDQPATSLNIEAGMKIDKNQFLEKVYNRFCLLYDKFIEAGFPLIKEEYEKRANFLNQKVTVKVFDKTVEGLATEITENGALKIVDNNNKEQILLIGDIL